MSLSHFQPISKSHYVFKNQLKSRPRVFTFTYTPLFQINRGQSGDGNCCNSNAKPQHKGQNIPFTMKAKACHSLPFSLWDGYLVQSACLVVVLKVDLPSPITSMNSNYLMFLLCHFSQTMCLFGILWTCRDLSGLKAFPSAYPIGNGNLPPHLLYSLYLSLSWFAP